MLLNRAFAMEKTRVAIIDLELTIQPPDYGG